MTEREVDEAIRAAWGARGLAHLEIVNGNRMADVVLDRAADKLEQAQS